MRVSVSPAPYPWSLENYCCDWPAWAGWRDAAGGPLWDEFVPQCYRLDYDAFAINWREQVAALRGAAPERSRDLVAGIRVVGDGPPTSWPDLARATDLSDALGGGYCLWFSRGVLELYPDALTAHLKAPGKGD